MVGTCSLMAVAPGCSLESIQLCRYQRTGLDEIPYWVLARLPPCSLVPLCGPVGIGHLVGLTAVHGMDGIGDGGSDHLAVVVFSVMLRRPALHLYLTLPLGSY